MCLVSDLKKLVTFICSSLSFTGGSPIIFGMQKFAAPLVGALFLGGGLFG